MKNLKVSDILAVIALSVSAFLSIYLFCFDKFSDEIIPKRNRSVFPGLTDTIYVSRFDKDHDIVIDLCNVVKNDLSEPSLMQIPDSTKQQIYAIAEEQAKTRKSVLYVLDANRIVKDSVIVNCFDCTTVGLTVPPKGCLVFKCVCGCLNNFCSYEFIKL